MNVQQVGTEQWEYGGFNPYVGLLDNLALGI